MRNEAGDVLGQVMTRPIREPGEPIEFRVPLNDGSNLSFSSRGASAGPAKDRPGDAGSRARRVAVDPWHRGRGRGNGSTPSSAG